MDFDRECGYYGGTDENDAEACCPDCHSLDISLESGDHGYVCNECGETFIVP